MAADASIEPATAVVIQGTLTADGRTLLLDEKAGVPAGRVRVRIDPIKMPVAQQGTLLPVEQIVEARYVQPAQMYLRFADGLEGTWTFEQLDLDMSEMKSETVKASNAGTYIEVQSNAGEYVQLDSSADFRYLVDEKYAAIIDKRINDLRMTPAELNEACRISMLTRDPRWNDVGDESDLFGDHDG